MSYIHAENLTKTFTVKKKREGHALIRERTTVEALRDVSFDIGEGELVGYIGPNGAGKSTTVKLLSGILTPDRGSATVGGMVPWLDRRAFVSCIGVVFGQRMQLWWDVPILDSYSLLRDIYRIPGDRYKKRLAELAEALDLNDLLHTPLRLLSLGQRMRAELCGSLLHGPKILFLDEPTIGLDAVSKLKLRDFLRWENAEHRTTIMLTTHDMEDIAALCGRVMVLGHGSKLYNGRLADLLDRYDRTRTVDVRFETGARLPALPVSVSVRDNDGGYMLTYQKDRLPTEKLLDLLRQAGSIRELTIRPQTVDHLIADMYRELGL